MERINFDTVAIYLLIAYSALVFGGSIKDRVENPKLKSQLEILADTDKNKILDSQEKINMYKMCGVEDTSKYLTTNELKKGINNYIK